MKVGDKCPLCKVGLLERTELGIGCTQCPFDLPMDELVEANERAKTEVGKYKWRRKSFKIMLDDPEEAETFLRGLILARQNNNSTYFPELIDAVNAILEPWREAKLKEELLARGG